MLAQDGTVVPDAAADVLAVIECGTVGRLSRLRALHPNHGKPWSEGEVSELRQLFTDGVGAADLAQAMCEKQQRHAQVILDLEPSFLCPASYGLG